MAWRVPALVALVVGVLVVALFLVVDRRSSAPVADAPSPSLSGRPVVAFVGDSYSAGSEASSPDKRWTTVLSAERGWNEINVAVPGMGYDVGRPTQHYASQVARAAASKPGAVIISGGWNDVARGVPTATIVEGLRETLAAVKKHVPEARVVVIAPIGPASSPPPDLVRLRDAAAPVMRSSGATWLDLDFPLTGHREWISPDGLHPNDAGYKRLAELTNARLK